LGAQSTVCGGGRYDGLVEEMGGKPTPGLGFGLGMERLMLILEAQKIEMDADKKCEIYFASMGESALKKALQLTRLARSSGLYAECDLCGRGLKGQMKYAGKIGAVYTVVIGEDELIKGSGELKNMNTGEKTPISLGEDFMAAYVAATVK
ncbi:MAG: His/Gly/Thr/Pro-type tRNA ligase C-terminal domain-containing protein, partial [Oscillospiraceae bacterium]